MKLCLTCSLGLAMAITGWANAVEENLRLDDPLGVIEEEKESAEGEEGNPSDPTAAVKYTDLRYRYLDLGGDADRNWLTVEGGFMVNPKIKLIYELHGWNSDLSGSSESSLESAHLKGIYISKPRRLTDKIGYKLAGGVELIANLGDFSDGTGSGAHIVAPFGGVAWSLPHENTLITLGQYFGSVDVDSDANDVNITALRVIWLKQLPHRMWFRLDDKFQINHELSESTSNTVELQLGKMINRKFGLYADLLYNTGGYQQYDWGVGIGARFMY